MNSSLTGLERGGLRFEAPGVERAYQTWRIRSALSLQVASFVALIVLWSFAILLQRWVQPPRYGIVAACAGISISASTLRIIVHRRARLLAWVLPLTSLSLVIAGTLGVGVVAWWAARLPEAALSACIILTFNSVNVRLSPRLVLATALPIWGIHLYFVVDALRAGELPFSSAVTHAVTAPAVLGAATMFSLMLERNFRQRFAQERVIEEQRALIEHERDRANGLLHSILPSQIVERLDGSPGAIADRFEDATVIFADIVGFTPLASKVSAEALVRILNEIFTSFDALAGSHGIEKIKTIGDAYLAVAGVPEPRPDHASAAADFALAVLDAVATYRREHGHDIEVRVGICSGPLIAGVLGTRKPAYDLWGDTVNTAARMESHGVAGKIQVAESTFRALAGSHRFEPRGVLEIKGKGPMNVWFLVERSVTGSESQRSESESAFQTKR